MIKAVIFDMDDTLLESKQTKYAAFKYLAKHFYQKTLSDEDIHKQWGKPFLEFIDGLLGDSDTPENIAKNYEAITNKFPNKLYPYAMEIVTQTAAKYPIGVLSSSSQTVVENDLRQTGFELQLFTCIQTSDDTSAHKPDPRVFDLAIKTFNTLGVQPKDILYIGDAINDYTAATGAGLQFIGISGRTTSKEAFDKVGAKTVRSLQDLNEFL